MRGHRTAYACPNTRALNEQKKSPDPHKVCRPGKDQLLLCAANRACCTHMRSPAHTTRPPTFDVELGAVLVL